jgi:hypothetical protein
MVYGKNAMATFLGDVQYSQNGTVTNPSYHHDHHNFLLYQNVHHHYKGISSGHSPRIATGLSALEYPEPLKAFVDFLSNVL